MNASERKALELLQERAASGPWTTTHADAANACGLRKRTWIRSVDSLAEWGKVRVHQGRHGVAFVLVSSKECHSAEPRNARNANQGMPGMPLEGEEGDDVVVDVRDEKQTTTTTTAVEDTARATQECHSRNATRPRNATPGMPLAPNARAELLELYRIALDLAEELGRVKAERDALRAAHRDPKPENLVAPTEAPCRAPVAPAEPPTPASASSAATPRAVTSARPPATSGEATPPAGTASRPAPSSGAHAATASASAERGAAPAAPPHPANSRGETPLEPEAVDADRDEDVRAFREIVASPHASELEVEAQVARALSYGVRLHQAVASVAIAQASGSDLTAPYRFAWAVINGKTLPSPGSSKTWAELRSTVLPALRAEAARKAAAKGSRGDSGGAHRVEHVSRPLQLNAVQQRQRDVAARQAARFREENRLALEREAAGGRT